MAFLVVANAKALPLQQKVERPTMSPMPEKMEVAIALAGTKVIR